MGVLTIHFIHCIKSRPTVLLTTQPTNFYCTSARLTWQQPPERGARTREDAFKNIVTESKIMMGILFCSFKEEKYS